MRRDIGTPSGRGVRTTARKRAPDLGYRPVSERAGALSNDGIFSDPGETPGPRSSAARSATASATRPQALPLLTAGGTRCARGSIEPPDPHTGCFALAESLPVTASDAEGVLPVPTPALPDRLHRAAARASAVARSIAARAERVDPDQALVLLLIAAFVLRAIWLTLPTNALIADENTYVNAARVIAGFPVPSDQPFSGAAPGVDPHVDQPVLGKLAIAASMRVLGDNPIGWRIPSLIAGMVALLALAAIVRRAGGSKWLSVLAVALLALDNLFLVHPGIATPDMPMVAGALVGAWLALGRRWVLAGVAFAIASLFKPIALFAVIAAIAMFAVDLWRERQAQPESERPAVHAH